MDQSTVTVLVAALLTLLGVCVTVASVLILSGGKVYQKIPEKSRPRRWVVAIFFSYFVTFCIWLPVWFSRPRSTTSHVLSFLFAAFTAFIAAWCALGRARDIALPVIALFERIIDSYRDGSGKER